MQYFTDMDINKPKQYTIDNGVKMPTLWWDLPSTGEDYKLGQELIKASGGTWLGGTNYVIKPNREIIHLPEGVSLRAWLENNNVNKKITNISILNKKSSLSKISLFKNKLYYSIAEKGQYSFDIYDLKGKRIEQIPSQHYDKGIYNINSNIKLSSGQYLLNVKGPNRTFSHKFLINRSK